MTIVPHPTALIDEQLGTIQAAARCVPPNWRSRFLESIADRLLGVEYVGDDDVQAAIAHVLERVGGAHA